MFHVFFQDSFTTLLNAATTRQRERRGAVKVSRLLHNLRFPSPFGIFRAIVLFYIIRPARITVSLQLRKRDAYAALRENRGFRARQGEMDSG